MDTMIDFDLLRNCLTLKCGLGYKILVENWRCNKQKILFPDFFWYII